MDRKRVLLITLVSVLLLVLTVGYMYAQEPGPQAEPAGRREDILQTPLGSGFTYQGQLKDSGGNPIDDTCDFTFSLWDAESAGSQVGADSVVTGVAVSDGYFAALVNGGGEFGAGAFVGEERWLEIAVQCTGDPTPVTLNPRHELSAAPYALSLQPGATISGTVAGGNSLTVINNDPTGRAVYGWASANSGITYGMVGYSDSTDGMGVAGFQTGYDISDLGTYWEPGGLFAGRNGVVGITKDSSGYGVFGWSKATSGNTFGVRGESGSTAGRGVAGYATASSGTTYGVYGRSNSTDGYGVYGQGPVYGVHGLATATSGSTCGVYGRNDSTTTWAAGVYGLAGANSGWTFGVHGQSQSTDGTGVRGWASATSGVTYGCYGESASTFGRGVAGQATATSGTTVGVYGVVNSPSGYAGYFAGDVHVTGDLSASGAKPFKIDHPLDPANQYLYHYSVESPEVLNQYAGNVTLDADGEAWVELPAWFEAINSDFRYQLTCIGGYAPVYIAEEIQGNRFQIAGGEPEMRVSWMVLALRSDPYVRYYGAPVEVDKPGDERGTYLYPELYGQPEELGLDYQRNPGREGPAAPEVPVPDTVPE